ncbi:MAG: ATPase domain-containing protein [Candidatus Micrarchaeia archaeon]
MAKKIPKAKAKAAKPVKHRTKAGRIATGIPGLDEVIEGGIPIGTLTLLSGKCGTGKSIFSLQFLCEGARQGEPGVYISLEEDPADILENIRPFGWKAEELIKQGKLAIIKPDLHRFDVLKQTIADEVDRIGAKRLVINPFTSLTAFFDNVYEARKALSDLRRQMKTLECTGLAVCDIKEDTNLYSSTGYEEFVASGVIVLDVRLNKESNSYVRTLFVRKMERSSHSLKLVPMEIGPKGVSVYPEAEVF